MAHAGVILGLAVDDVLVEDIGTTAKTFPDFAGVWAGLRSGDPVTTGRYSRPRPRALRAPAPPHPPPHQGPPDLRRRRRRAVVVTVDRGRFTLLVDGHRVMAMKSRPLGRKGVVVGDRVRVVGDTSGDDGSLARIVEVVRAHHRRCAARPTTTTRSSG